MATAVSASALLTTSAATCIQQQQQKLMGGNALRIAATPIGQSVSRRSVVVKATSDKPVKPGRQLIFASQQSLTYLDGTLPGDFGFDPLGLSDPDGVGGFIDPNWLRYAELINGRFAMLGAAGAIAPEIFGKLGLIPQETALPWFQTGVIPPMGSYTYWADPYTLFVFEMALFGFAEHRRAQDYYKPGSMGKQYFLGFEKFLGGSGDPVYPGGPLFNFLGLGKDEKSMMDLKLKEVKNGRLAMLAIVGYFIQAIFTGVGPFQNLLDHLADPVHNNVLTNLKIH
ncbi:unnamed protein product [Calypogeia fissa]